MNIVKKEEKIMYENKKIFILGMARSGYEVAKVLAKNNNQLMICDKQTQDEDKICELVDSIFLFSKRYGNYWSYGF